MTSEGTHEVGIHTGEPSHLAEWEQEHMLEEAAKGVRRRTSALRLTRERFKQISEFHR